MKLIIKIFDTYELAPDNWETEYLVYVVNDDGTLVRAYNQIYGEPELMSTAGTLYSQYNINETIRIPNTKSTEEVLNEIRN